MKRVQLLVPILIILSSLLSCGEKEQVKQIVFAEDEIIIDGDMKDLEWKKVKWQKIDQMWQGQAFSETDFNGRYKLLWNANHIYVLAEIIDDVLLDTHVDGLDSYWDDDCLEIFIDENASGGNHQYNYNAFAYHIGLDNRAVDLGKDGLPHYFDHINCVRKTFGTKSIWELSMDIYDDSFHRISENGRVDLYELKELGFAIAYCDNDKSEERENFIGSVMVGGVDKNRGWIDAGIFEKVVLVKK